METPQQWHEILKAARGLLKDGKTGFTSHELAVAVGFKKTAPTKITNGPRKGQMGKGSIPSQLAAGWLSKFVKWGYVIITSSAPTEGPRRLNTYSLTPSGISCVVRPGTKERLERLIEAVQAFRDLRGRQAEGEAWKDLLKTLNEVAEDLPSA